MSHTEKNPKLTLSEQEILNVIRSNNLDEMVIGVLADLTNLGAEALLNLMHDQLLLLSLDEEETVTDPKSFYQNFMLLTELVKSQIPEAA